MATNRPLVKRLTDDEVASRLQIHLRTLRRLVMQTPENAPRPWVKIGRQRRWADDNFAIDEWLRIVEAGQSPKSAARATCSGGRKALTPAEVRLVWNSEKQSVQK
ncbi:MAG: hypothetical protein HN348_31030 [Proteobacteria bacterium]|nr:hypothetical protein [Pseudomonadota bacterium]